MKNYSRRKWTDKEDIFLSSLLHDGVELNDIAYKMTNRTYSAIRKRAFSLNYRSKTVDGITKFYKGVKHRSKKSDEIVEVSLQTLPTNSITNISEGILSKNSLNTTNKDAICLAMKILDDNGLKIEPKIVYELSTHILST